VQVVEGLQPRVGIVLEAELGALVRSEPAVRYGQRRYRRLGLVWHRAAEEGSGVNRFHRYYCASPGWARLVQTTLVPAVLEGTELGRRVLEIGPGPGLTTEILAGVAPQLTAIEIDPELATVARDRVPPPTSCRGTRRRCRLPTPASAPWCA
jgi:hypothetical protein